MVGRIFKANAAPVDAPWMWTLAFGHHEDRKPNTATRPRAKLRWPRSLKAGGESDFSHRHRSLPQSSSASRFTAAAFGFFIAAGDIARAEALRDDAFEAKLTSMAKHHVARFCDVIVNF